MEGKLPKLLTKIEYARHRGVVPSQITKAVQSGKITTVMVNGREMIDPDLADRQMQENTAPWNDKKQKEDEAPNPKLPSYAVSRQYKEAMNAKILEIELDLKSGKVVNTTEVRNTIFNVGRTIRDSFLQLPDRLSGELTSILKKKNPELELDSNDMHVIITKEINKLLEHLVEANKW